MMNKGSFKSKLVLSYFLLIFVSLGFVAFFLDKHLEDGALRQIKSSLANEARLIERQISVSPADLDNPVKLDRLCRDLGGRIDSRVTIIGMDGKVLADSEVPFSRLENLENHGSRPEVIEALRSGMGEQIRYSDTLKIDMLYMAIIIKVGGVNTGILRLALPLTSVQKVLFAVKRLF